MIIHTYGGGEILQKLFDGIAMLMNNNGGGVARPLIIIFVSISSLWIITKSFFSASAESILQRYFFPILAVLAIFLIPSQSVRIEDAITKKYYKVDHVPFLLAQFSQFASSLGYRITEAVESVMHTPNDTKYNSTGMIFGAENALAMDKIKIRNGDFARNLKEFSKQCVFYDLLLGRYTQQEMQKTTDLWKFLGERTSKTRMIDYIDADLGNTSTINCKSAVQKMTPAFKNESRYYALQDIGKNLPITYQALTKMRESAEDLISQQLLFDFFSDGFDSHGFAKRRAHEQQLSTYHTVGSLASSSLVSMRAVLEALIYAAFIFVLPMSVLPMGLRFLSTWVWLVIWIQIWPPFFAILNYFMQCAAQARTESIFKSLTDGERGLSIFTNAGLFEINQDIAALSGFLAASIPFISYAILQGGLSSFAQLAGTMMSPATNAASSAAGEMTSGNYSFANTSFGQESFKNKTALQNNLAPTLQSGYITQSDGVSTTTYGSENIIRQSGSEFRNNLFSDESLSSSLNRSYQEAETYAKSSQHSLTDSISKHARNYGDLTDYLSKSDNASQNWTGRDGVSVQESANYMKNAAESLANQSGISERDSMEIIASTSPLFKTISSPINAQFCDSNATEESWNAAKNITESESYQKHYQNINDWATSSGIGTVNDEGSRVVAGYSKSIDEVHSAVEQYQHSLSEMQQISENKSFAENLSISERKSLNQPFINWASEKFAHEGGFGKVKDILTNDSGQKIDPLIQEFLSLHAPSQNFDMSNPSQTYEDAFSNFEISKNNLSNSQVSDDILQTASSHIKSELMSAQKTYSEEIHSNTSIRDEIRGTREILDDSHQQNKSVYDEKSNKYEFYHAIKNSRNFVGNTAVDLTQQLMKFSGIKKENIGQIDKPTHSKPFWYVNKND